MPDVPTDADTPLGVVKCAPLFLSMTVLEAVEKIRATSGAVIELQSFRTMRVAFIAPTGRVRGNAFQRATAALSHALEWYGSSLAPTIATDTTTPAVAQGYRDALESHVDLILAAGASGTDPADVVFDGLRLAGGRVDQIGIPAEPGTACWIGDLAGTPVLGLASCELFGQPGALDMLLPRLLVGEPLDRGLLRRIALGGLLVGGPSRVAPYHDAER
jgi:molybdenum cofactor cytidylyltransferase